MADVIDNKLPKWVEAVEVVSPEFIATPDYTPQENQNQFDYERLRNQPTIPSSYTLPVATTSVLGGVKVDWVTIVIASEIISAVKPLAAVLTQSGTQTITNNSQTTLTGMTVAVGNAAMIAASGKITIGTSGTYLFSMGYFDASGWSTGTRQVILRKNGSSNAFVWRVAANAANTAVPNFTFPLTLVATDYIELAVYQNSWVDMDVTTAFFSAVILV